MAQNMQLNSKTGYIKLQVPPKKLGAVLSAIGAALDGHPWIPYVLPKVQTRGCRGGRRKRVGKSMEPSKGKQAFSATNPLEGSSVGGVPQLHRSTKTTVKSTQKPRKGLVSNNHPVATQDGKGYSENLPNIQFGDIKYSPNLVTKPSYVQVVKTAERISYPQASYPTNGKIELGCAGRKDLFTSPMPSTSDGGTHFVRKLEERVKNNTQNSVDDAVVSDQHCVDVINSKSTEVEALRQMVVNINAPSRKISVRCQYVKFRERRQNRNYGFFGIGKDLSYLETEQDYETAHRLYISKHQKRCTECIVPGPRFDNVAHLSVCGNSCSCKASSNSRYIELLTKHRRCFVSTSAGSSRNSYPSHFNKK